MYSGKSSQVEFVFKIIISSVCLHFFKCDGKPFATKPMLTIHLMEAHEFNPIESVSYKAELADSLTNDTSAAQGMCFEFSRQLFFGRP